MPDESASSSLDLAAWPSVLALPLRVYQREQQPVLKLWLMCDVVELTIRLAAVIGVAELRAAHAAQIHRPTSAQRKSVLQQILHNLPQPSPMRQDPKVLVASLVNVISCPGAEVCIGRPQESFAAFPMVAVCSAVARRRLGFALFRILDF